MTVKEYLSQAMLLDRRIKNKKKRLDVIRSQVSCTSPRFTDEPKRQGVSTSSVERISMSIIELEECIEGEIIELTRLQKEISLAISAVNNPTYESILEMRYLLYYSWDQIIQDMGYSRRHVFKLHGEALKMVRFSNKP